MTDSQNTHVKGDKGEDYVCAKLKEQGITILDRNVREKFAEIDIVARDGDTLCFIEVRTRQNTKLGHPSETINAKKKQSIRRAAEAYLMKQGNGPQAVRFDVATVVWDSMEFLYFPNAF